ncbi:MAG TPA: radical SAM protein, partial [Desulfurivibrionaceae bacterium]|nr:radical SAM protein [Desulfurivibrionaceae bacterium]
MRHKPAASHDPLAQERGTIRKKWAGRLPVALLFPNAYAIGASNLGFQLVYHLANQHPDIVCERFFLPEPGVPLLSCESRRPLRDFAVLCYAAPFEADFLNLLAMLRQSGAPLLAAERGEADPLVIGGGVLAFMNPEPLAPFTDLFVVGEAEPVLPALLDTLVNQRGSRDRAALLRHLAISLPGCYAPRFYTPEYDGDGTVAAVNVAAGLPARIRKVVATGDVAGHSQLLSPEAEFADLFLTELGRGCTRGCRFCAAGFVYRPPRLWSAEAILAALKERPAAIRRVGLLGMEMARPHDLEQIATALQAQHCALSFSSLRADALGPELVALLGTSGIKTATIAPDGPSERLRRVINKGITREEVLSAARTLAEQNITQLKLYFMLGLPTETIEDLAEMALLVREVKAELLAVGRPKGRLANITVSISSFVPKPWTPFQYHPFAALSALKNGLQFLRKELGREPNVRLAADQPARAFFQAVLARGDRRLGLALAEALDGQRSWQQALAAHGLT